MAKNRAARAVVASAVTADQLIDETRGRGAVGVVSASVLSELRKVIEYNEGKIAHQRVGANRVLVMLESLGLKVGEVRLNRICREHFGRKSFALK